MPKITSTPLLDALRECGIATSNTRRVVIDLQVDQAPVVYLEQYGDESLIDVVLAVSSVDVVVKRQGLTDTEQEADRQAALARGE